MELSLQKHLGNASGLVATGKCRLGDNELEVTLLPGPGGSRAGKRAPPCRGTCEKVRVAREASSDGQERVGGVCSSDVDCFQIKPAYSLKERKTTTVHDQKPKKLTGGQDITRRFHF